MSEGLFIVFDGIDGAGKTTQANLLHSALNNANIDCILSKEPTDGKFGKKMRSSATSGRLSLDEELQYFIEDRKEHINELILPSLEKGMVVILDRYFYSTLAYQGVLSKDYLKIEKPVKDAAIIPDITFILDLDVPLSLHRIKNTRGDIPNEFEKEDNLNKVKQVFSNLCDTEDEIFKVNATLPISSIHQIVLEKLKELFKEKLCKKGYKTDCGGCGFKISNTCDWYLKISGLKQTVK